MLAPEPSVAHEGMPMNRLALALLILALSAGAALASQPGTVVTKNWKAMDQCAKDAQTAFPDFTAESNAKREAKERECLEGKNLPPRAPMSPER
jgi:hypothetical protein